MSTWRFLIYGGVTLTFDRAGCGLCAGRQVRTDPEHCRARQSPRWAAARSSRRSRPASSEPIEVAIALSSILAISSETEDRLHFVMHEARPSHQSLLALAQAMTRPARAANRQRGHFSTRGRRSGWRGLAAFDRSPDQRDNGPACPAPGDRRHPSGHLPCKVPQQLDDRGWGFSVEAGGGLQDLGVWVRCTNWRRIR